ncbi:MAG: beta-lactamase family protein [Chloroflexi bacterium]|nr:beta-lactamase family protein [Chloroflexota bacterium]
MNAELSAQVSQDLEDIVKAGPEVGLQIAAYVEGELVIDAWGGLADERTGRKVDGETLFMISSTGKGITATCLHILADQGRLKYDEPIATYWPEWAQKGKETATVRHALSHKAGAPRIEGQTPDMLLNWDATCRAIAETPAAFEPGTKTAYHVYSFGYICGEILRRIDGRPISQFLQDEICRPLGIDSLYFGIPDGLMPRVARLKDWNPEARGMNADWHARPEVMRASIPAMAGIANARGVARHYAMLEGGGELDGVRLLSPERIREASEVQTDEEDFMFHVRAKRSMGYRLANDTGPGGGPRAFGHVGGGGSFGYADPGRHLAIALAKNYMCPPSVGNSPVYVPDDGPQRAYDAVARALKL